MSATILMALPQRAQSPAEPAASGKVGETKPNGQSEAFATLTSSFDAVLSQVSGKPAANPKSDATQASTGTKRGVGVNQSPSADGGERTRRKAKRQPQVTVPEGKPQITPSFGVGDTLEPQLRPEGRAELAPTSLQSCSPSPPSPCTELNAKGLGGSHDFPPGQNVQTLAVNTVGQFAVPASVSGSPSVAGLSLVVSDASPALMFWGETPGNAAGTGAPLALRGQDMGSARVAQTPTSIHASAKSVTSDADLAQARGLASQTVPLSSPIVATREDAAICAAPAVVSRQGISSFEVQAPDRFVMVSKMEPIASDSKDRAVPSELVPAPSKESPAMISGGGKPVTASPPVVPAEGDTANSSKNLQTPNRAVTTLPQDSPALDVKATARVGADSAPPEAPDTKTEPDRISALAPIASTGIEGETPGGTAGTAVLLAQTTPSGMEGAKTSPWMKKAEESDPVDARLGKVLPGLAPSGATLAASPVNGEPDSAHSHSSFWTSSAPTAETSAAPGTVPTPKPSAAAPARASGATQTESAFAQVPVSPAFSNLDARPILAGAHSLSAEATPNRPAIDLDQVHALVSNWAVEVKRSRTEVMDVVLKPNPQTELSLRLNLEDGVVAVTAALKQGDFTALNAHWEQLQTSLSLQGIRLAALQPTETMPGSNPASTPGFGQPNRQPGFRHEPEESRSSSNTFPTVPTPQPKKLSQVSAARRRWESWA